MPDLSPLAPSGYPEMHPVAGVRLGATSAGIKYSGRTDLLLVELAPGTAVAGVFTRSQTAAAPVVWCRSALEKGSARAVVVNSGNANAFSGRAGKDSVDRTIAVTAKLIGCAKEEVFVASTGVIGEPLDDDALTAALPGLRETLSEHPWRDAAAAIMTTDTFPKIATRTAKIDDREVRINGFAKGSGMIAPDMATMLGFVFTDADLPAPVLQTLLNGANKCSFNSITVDSDTSTNDTVLLCATGRAGNPKVDSAKDPALRSFRAEFESLMIDLAHQIVRDGEGATKFVTVSVSGAVSARAARVIALAVANSPLVKTAIAGEDANWGRIVMAVGKSGERADADRLAIAIGGIPITDEGQVRPGYDETPVAAHMKGQEITLEIDVGVGRGRATVWTCDLTHGYIEINADYRS